MLPEMVFVVLFGIFLLLAIMIVVLMVGTYKLFSKYELMSQHLVQMEAEKQENVMAIEAKAEEEAQEILKDARIKSQRLVEDAQMFSTTGSKKLQDALDFMLQDQTRAFTDEMKNARAETEKRLLSVADEVNQMAATELKVFANTLQEQTKKTQAEAAANIQQVFASMGEEVEKYKKARLAMVDQVVRDMVLKVAREVMGETLTMSDHETLVIKALEEAKKKNVI